jgi:hypothetical protein
VNAPAQPMDLAGPIRVAILGNSAITDLLGIYLGEPAVFTRRPVPDDAPYPMIQVSPNISTGNQDFLRARLPMPRRDLGVFGRQPDDYRTVEAIAFLLRQQFHRQRFSIDLSPYFNIVELVADGPISAPTDDQMLVGRAVPLRFKLEDLSTG